jgi:hypothetical protein
MATKNLVPRATGEGGIGTALKKWLNGYITHLFATDISSEDGTNTSTPAQIAGAVSKAHDQAHKTSHEPGGADALTVDAAAATGSLRTLGTSSTSACAGNDSRLSDARAPTAHNTSHQNGGSDEIATATATANAIPKAGATGELAVGWIPTGTTAGKIVALDGSAKLPAVDGSQLTNLPASSGSDNLYRNTFYSM